ncbi:MAG: acyl-ACP--UDP-N-acetylglucosamine O-acyltransferase [Verrucomicrobia bacterium]|nr:acyl-ACP--UDP-N-acetylglucosamine O-acyltransferase [Verrucomicrobiota bacterium]MBV9672546.1 acyl-ACP--UDP-N-acetylglucosamine O-acyltransferase [Verrucomicrobiota bacterium]
MIHPTAIIDSEAKIDSEVEIGPYVLIQGPVRLCSGTAVMAHAVISGQVEIGNSNQIGFGAIIGAPPQDLSFDSQTITGVQIGDKNVIREYCTIHRGTKDGTFTRIGSDCFLMAGAHLGHNVSLGDHVILANNVLAGGYVQIQDRAFVGGASVIHQFTRLGTCCLMQGGSAVSKDIPPFAIAAGKNSVVALNVIGMRRAGMQAVQRKEVREAFELFYQSSLNRSQALAEARNRRWTVPAEIFWNFVAESKRGVCAMTSWRSIKRGDASDLESQVE